MRKKAVFALLLCTIIWGMAGPVIKFTLGYIPPFAFLTIRMFLASLIVAPFMFATGRIKQLRKDGIKEIIFLSLLAQPICLGLTFLGYKYTSSLEGTILGATFPIFLTLGGAVFLKEEVTKLEQLGILLTILGTFLIIFIEPLTHNNQVALTSIKGNLLIFLGNLSWLAYVILEKKRLKKRGVRKTYHFEGIAFSFIVAFFALLPFAFIESMLTTKPLLPQILNPRALGGLFYMGVFSSVIAYIAYDYGLSKTEASETGVFSYLQPFFALPAAYLLLGEIPTAYMIPGLFIIGLGFILNEKGSSG